MDGAKRAGLMVAPPSYIEYQRYIGYGEHWIVENSAALRVYQATGLAFFQRQSRDFFETLLRTYEQRGLPTSVNVDRWVKSIPDAMEDYFFFGRIAEVADLAWKKSTVDNDGEMQIDIWDHSEEDIDVPLRIVPTSSRSLLSFIGQYWREGKIIEILPSLAESDVWPPSVFEP